MAGYFDQPKLGGFFDDFGAPSHHGPYELSLMGGFGSGGMLDPLAYSVDPAAKQQMNAAVQEQPAKQDFTQGGLFNIIAAALGGAAQGAGGTDPYMPQLQQQRMMEYSEQKRQRELQDAMAEWQRKQDYERQNYLPDTEKKAQYYEGQGQGDVAADLRAKERMVPISRADPATGEVRYEYVRPSTLMGGGEDLPSPKSAAEAAALPPGTRFRAPDGSIRRVPGGASPSNGSGGFLGGY